MIFSGSKYDFLDSDNCIRFNGIGFESTYGVEMFVEENPNSRTRISHKAFVKVDDYTNDTFVVSVVVWNFLINNREPDLIMEQLAEKCRRPIEKLKLLVDQKWRIAGLKNHAEILEIWETTKEKLEREYTGDIFERYIETQDFVIRDPSVLLEKLKKDTFIGQYFCPIYNSAFTQFKFNTNERVKMLNIEYDLDVQFSLLEGTSDEPLKVQKSLNQDSARLQQMPVGNYTVLYELNERFAITNVSGTFENHNRKFSFQIEQDNNEA